MAIEDAIAALTKAVEANTAALKGGAGTAAKASTAGKAADGKKELTVADVQKKFGAYIDTDDADVLAARKANIKKICTKLGTKKVTEADPEQWPLALKMLADFIKAEEDGDGDDGSI